MKKFKTAAAALAVAMMIVFVFVGAAFAQAAAAVPPATEKSKLDKLIDKVDGEVEQRLGALEREVAVGKEMRGETYKAVGDLDRRLGALEKKSLEKKSLENVAGAVRKYRITGDVRAFLAVEAEIRMLKILSATMERELLSIVEKITRLEMRLDRAEQKGAATEGRVGDLERRVGESDGRHMSHERRFSESESRHAATEGRLGQVEQRVGSLEKSQVRVGSLFGVGLSTGFSHPEFSFGGTLRAHGAQSGFMLDLDVGVSKADSWNVSSVVMTAGGIYGSVRDTIRLWAGGFVGAASAHGLSSDRSFVGGPQIGIEFRLGGYCEFDVGIGPVFVGGGNLENGWLVTGRLRCDPVRAAGDLNREVVAR